MTAPNLKNPTTITGKTECVGIGTTSKVGILTNLQDSNKVLKINFTTKALNEVSSFTTKENPYYFGNI